MLVGLVVYDDTRRSFYAGIIKEVPGVADVISLSSGLTSNPPIIMEPALLRADVVIYHCGDLNSEFDVVIRIYRETHPRNYVVLFSGAGVLGAASTYAGDPFVCAVEPASLESNIREFLSALAVAREGGKDLEGGCRILQGIRPQTEVSLQLLYGLLSIHLYRELFPSGERLRQAAEAVKKNLEGLDREVLEIAVAAEVAERLLSPGSGNRPPSDLGSRFPDADRTISKLLAEARQGWGLPVARPSSLDDVINALTDPAADEYWAEYLSELRDLLLKY